ncbi:glycerophosphodiester phosphodiesterase [Bacillus inaquosorum]|uniref:Glycerophosphoryl diester phosphodiesterase n=1 Tax=Bacillus inaquosorum KCTC 13429 TaxID=1236548 RepID=A0A9W5PDI9_9BACI|nr:glycerophosphodiester phosphodiesterase [Bacillus inaquosorum]RKQ26184.1 glycerophosphodiester phosphodiesterase [Bacillus subtilis]AWM17557.1 glycerophosphodiester phosphodiesterase [Bacillus inaquosorum]ELS61878.1 glycerophosphoryl diester phosphodiesterase [Bacillus inaquosorum KCTC 13429]MCY7906211.1 glycerophosphodiester phosphodiesterase [Bacillus inaquosorum]MCY9050827.1 glycerophosphodiester phosphodiesterase [Bacillus inaquosorum]
MTKIFAHRGASGQFPENTMLAFEKGIEAGADGIELDVQLTKDGRIVVIHDERLDRTTSLKGFVKDTAYDVIKTANAAANHNQMDNDIKVPLLEDVLSWAEKKNFLINIELKNSVIRYEGMEEKVLEAVKRFNIEERVILSTFNHESLALCARLAPHIERAALTSDVLYQADRYITSIPASGYHPKLNSPATADKVLKKMRNSSIKVRPYTVNRPEDMKRLFEAGEDGIFTDFPAKALALLKNK